MRKTSVKVDFKTRERLMSLKRQSGLKSLDMVIRTLIYAHEKRIGARILDDIPLGVLE